MQNKNHLHRNNNNNNKKRSIIFRYRPSPFKKYFKNQINLNSVLGLKINFEQTPNDEEAIH